MIGVTILVLCTASALGHPTKSASVEDSWIEFIDANCDALVHLTRELSKISNDGWTSMKNILDNLILFTSPGILDFLNFEDDGEKSASDIPITEPAVEIGSKDSDGKLWGTTAENSIKTSKSIDIWNSSGQTNMKPLDDTSDKSAKIVKYVSDEVETINDEHHKNL